MEIERNRALKVCDFDSNLETQEENNQENTNQKAQTWLILLFLREERAFSKEAEEYGWSASFPHGEVQSPNWKDSQDGWVCY